MFLTKDEQLRKLVTFYIVYTCIYFPILLVTLFWSENIYSIGKYKFQSILTIIIVAELVKCAASSLHFKVNDVNLSKKQEDKSAVQQIKNWFNRHTIKDGLATLLTVSLMIAVFFVVAILYGAEAFGKYEETLMLSSLLSVLTILPACINLGSNSALSMMLGSKANDKLETLVYQNMYFTLCGAWLGAFVIPLDWDRPWQQWPIPCATGGMLGFILSHVIMVFRIAIFTKTKSKSK